MQSPRPDDLAAAVSAGIRAERGTVTTQDTERISSQISSLNGRLTQIIALMAIILALLISTYGFLTFFAWRLVDAAGVVKW